MKRDKNLQTQIPAYDENTPRALITGATGFIGSHLANTLVEKGWNVTCLIRQTSKTDFLQKLPVSLVVGHVNDLNSLEKAVEGKDYIFHSAAQIRPVRREAYDLANHKLTKNLIRACLKKNKEIKRFIYISSISAAGPSTPDSYFDENQPCVPTSEYGRSKLRGEEALQEHWNSIPVTIIRPPNVYGPRQQETELLIKLIKRRIVPLLRETGEMTSLIYINDLVDGIIQSSLSPITAGQIYYLTDGKGYSWRNIILKLKKHTLNNSFYIPFPESLIYFAAWIVDMIRKTGLITIFFGRKVWKAMTQTPWLFSSAKAEKDFNFRPKYNIEEGTQATEKYYFPK